MESRGKHRDHVHMMPCELWLARMEEFNNLLRLISSLLLDTAEFMAFEQHF
jgi:hypothetical protein